MDHIANTSARANRRFGWAALALALLSLLAAIVSGGVARSAQADTGVRIEQAWVSSVPIPGHPAAGYLVLVGGAKADTLTGISSAGAKSIELHSNAAMGGMMHMSTDASVGVPAGKRVVFAERGRHLMIYGLRPGVTSLPLTFKFASGRILSVTAPVRSIGTGPSLSKAAATRTI